MDRLRPKKKSTGTACAARLLNTFYTNEELKGKNLKKSDKINGLDETVVESIVGKNYVKVELSICFSIFSHIA